MAFDTADLAKMEADGILLDVITHEMGHVLGVGSMWARRGLISPPPGDPLALANPVFNGPAAMIQFGLLLGEGGPEPVPVENQGGIGTARAHWRESVFGNELMTGYVDVGNPLSRLTVASLQDIGYEVDLEAADQYTLPDTLFLARSGRLAARTAPTDNGYMLSTIPIPVLVP